MRRKRAVTLCIICFFCIAGLFARKFRERTVEAWKFRIYPMKIMDVSILEDADFLENREKKEATEGQKLYFEETVMPYDRIENVFFLSQDAEAEDWEGVLAGYGPKEERVKEKKKGFLCAPPDPYWNRKGDAVRENHVFTIWLVEEDGYYEFRLAVSGMPVISIDTREAREAEEVDADIDPDKKYFDSETLYYGTIQMYNPKVGSDEYEIYQAGVCYHEKGASSKEFEKKGYALKLLDSEGQKINIPLLGMRSDNSWKLNALNTDSNRIREITAAQIWEQFDNANMQVNEAGPRLKYTEVILDHEYKGVYCLVEPVDRKKLQLDEEDVLYKVIDWGRPKQEAIQDSIDKKWKLQYPVRIRYPDEITDYARAWSYMKEYLDIFYERPEFDYQEAVSKVNLSNLCDMFMLIMTTSASDNCLKNTYYAAVTNPDESYVMLQIPWDLDYTFGNCYKYGVEYNNVEFNEDYTVVYTENALQRIQMSNREEIDSLFMTRWARYRAGFLSTENILKLLRDNRDYLIQTGAMEREAIRWPDSHVSSDIDELLKFQEKRMEWLDEFFAEWITWKE